MLVTIAITSTCEIFLEFQICELKREYIEFLNKIYVSPALYSRDYFLVKVGYRRPVKNLLSSIEKFLNRWEYRLDDVSISSISPLLYEDILFSKVNVRTIVKTYYYQLDDESIFLKQLFSVYEDEEQ